MSFNRIRWIGCGVLTVAAALTSSMFACVGDAPLATSDGSTDAAPADVAAESAPLDASGCGSPPHTCATGYTCQNGHCGNDVVELAMGGYQSCALLYNGDVWCWGLNTYGAIGVAPSSQVFAPQKVAGVSNIAHVKGHLHSVCAADVSGSVWCWGLNDVGQLGHASGTQGDTSCGTDNKPCNPTPTLVAFPPSTRIVELAFGGSYDANALGTVFACARSEGTKVFCWGGNGMGVTGQPQTMASVSVPTEVPGVFGAVHITAAHAGHACAMVSGASWCWGWNRYGQLGHLPSADAGDVDAVNGQGLCSPSPVKVDGITGVTAIATGDEFTCVATSAGAGVRCWGVDDFGVFGDGRNQDQQTIALPGAAIAPVAGSVSSLVTHRYTVFVIDSSGNLWSWGDNAYGELGVGVITGPSCPSSQPCNSTPQKVVGLSNVIQVAVGVYDIGAVTADGKAYTWGIDSHGPGDQACYNSRTCNPTPQPLLGLPQ